MGLIAIRLYFDQFDYITQNLHNIHQHNHVRRICLRIQKIPTINIDLQIHLP